MNDDVLLGSCGFSRSVDVSFPLVGACYHFLLRLVSEPHNRSFPAKDAITSESTTILASLLSQGNIASTRTEELLLSLLAAVNRSIVSELL